MISSRLTKEGGSVATFVIVGVILAAVMIGGVYLLQKRDQQSPKAPVAVKNDTKSPSSSPEASKQPSPSKKPSATRSQSPAPKPEVTTKKDIPTAGSLPATGPQDNLIGATMLAIFVAVAIAYLRSVRIRYGYQTE